MLGVAMQCVLTLAPVDVHGLCLRQGAVVLYVCLPTGGCWEQRHLFPCPTAKLAQFRVVTSANPPGTPGRWARWALSIVAGRQPQAHCLPLSSWVKERQESVPGGHPFSLTQETLTVCEGFPFFLPTHCLHALAGAPAAVLDLKVTPRMEAKEQGDRRSPSPCWPRGLRPALGASLWTSARESNATSLPQTTVPWGDLLHTARPNLEASSFQREAAPNGEGLARPRNASEGQLCSGAQLACLSLVPLH